MAEPRNYEEALRLWRSCKKELETERLNRRNAEGNARKATDDFVTLTKEMGAKTVKENHEAMAKKAIEIANLKGELTKAKNEIAQLKANGNGGKPDVQGLYHGRSGEEIFKEASAEIERMRESMKRAGEEARVKIEELNYNIQVLTQQRDLAVSQRDPRTELEKRITGPIARKYESANDLEQLRAQYLADHHRVMEEQRQLHMLEHNREVARLLEEQKTRLSAEYQQILLKEKEAWKKDAEKNAAGVVPQQSSANRTPTPLTPPRYAPLRVLNSPYYTGPPNKDLQKAREQIADLEGRMIGLRELYKDGKKGSEEVARVQLRMERDVQTMQRRLVEKDKENEKLRILLHEKRVAAKPVAPSDPLGPATMHQSKPCKPKTAPGFFKVLTAVTVVGLFGLGEGWY